MKGDCSQVGSDPAACFLGDPEDISILLHLLAAQLKTEKILWEQRLHTVATSAFGFGSKTLQFYSSGYPHHLCAFNHKYADWKYEYRHKSDNQYANIIGRFARKSVPLICSSIQRKAHTLFLRIPVSPHNTITTGVRCHF